ncbi:hypothetical protein GCM10020000_18080 [Streptomyces olivoverticillatus]
MPSPPPAERRPPGRRGGTLARGRRDRDPRHPPGGRLRRERLLRPLLRHLPPQAANTDGTPFTAVRHTPARVDNLRTAGMLTDNPNAYTPRRLGPEQALTCDQNHSYGPEQYAANDGKADRFVENTDSGRCSGHLFGEPGLVMDYYDGNTVTALWNYAQHFSMSDRSFGTTYGPSTPGAVNLVSGRTQGVYSTDPASGTQTPKRTAKPDAYAVVAPDAQGVGTLVNDPEPAYDDCSGKDHTGKSALAALQGRNIGDLLNDKGVSWGWFQGGFRPSTAWDGKPGHYATCSGTTHANVGGAQVIDYVPHHAPFQYYPSTANPHHLPPRRPPPRSGTPGAPTTPTTSPTSTPPCAPDGCRR